MFHANQLLQIVGPEFGLHLLNFYSFIADLFNNSYKFGNNVYRASYNYMSGKYDTWLFLNSSGGPIQATNVENDVSDYIIWTYNSTDNTIMYKESSDEVTRSLPWLSAKIVCGEDEYESLDDLLSTFTFTSPRKVIPSPSTIVHCWSIANKIWFTSHQNVVLEIINNDGDIITAPIFNRSDNDVEEWLKLFDDEDDDAEDDDEAEDEEDEEDADEDEEDANDTKYTDGYADDEGEDEKELVVDASDNVVTANVVPELSIDTDIPKPKSVDENLYSYTCTAEVEDIAKILEMMKNGILPKSSDE